MRRCVFAAAIGTLLTALAGCPAELPLSRRDSAEDEQPAPSLPGAGPSEDEQPAPAPPPPPPPPSPPKTPEELAQEALGASDLEEQEIAAVQLAEHGRPAREHLQRVLSESQTAAVRAACIRGLAAQWDYDSMPVFLDALDDESEVVRTRAAAAVRRMMSLPDYGYRAGDPPEKRADAVNRFREEWEEFRHSVVFENWKKRLEGRERREERERLEKHP